jgi:hypothetical protein
VLVSVSGEKPHECVVLQLAETHKYIEVTFLLRFYLSLPRCTTRWVFHCFKTSLLFFLKHLLLEKKACRLKKNRRPSSLCNVRGSSRQEAHGTKYEKGVILFRVRAKVWVLFVCPYVDKTRQVATKTFSMWFKSTLAWDLVGSMLWDHVAQH